MIQEARSRKHNMPCVKVTGPNRPRLEEVVAFAWQIGAVKVQKRKVISERFCVWVPWSRGGVLPSRRGLKTILAPVCFRDYYERGDKSMWVTG